MIYEAIMAEADREKSYLIETRRWLHAHGETGFDLPETTEYIHQKLNELGISHQNCGKAGITANIGTENSGYTILLRATLDSVPAADNDHNHSDIQTAMLLGAAKLLKEHEAELSGTVKLMFQPASESFQGCQDMIQSGILKTPDVHASLAIRPIYGTSLSTGTVILPTSGVVLPATDQFSIMVQGKGCHGATPQDGIDPLTAAAHILTALQEIKSRELASTDDATLTIGTMHAGNKPGMIPDSVCMEGVIRTLDKKIRCRIKHRTVEIATGVASAFRTAAEVSFPLSCPAMISNDSLTQEMQLYISDLLGPKKVILSDECCKKEILPFTNRSDDYAYISQEIPSLMIALSGDESDSILTNGAAIYAYTAMRWINERQNKTTS